MISRRDANRKWEDECPVSRMSVYCPLRMKTTILGALLTLAASAAGAVEPSWGTLDITITETPSGKAIPGKVCLLHAANGGRARLLSQSNKFQAVRPEVAYTLSGRVVLAVVPGKYRVIGGRGTEYSVSEAPANVPEGGTVAVNIVLRREVDTAGYIAGDMHLHTIFSDGDPSIEERLITLAGEGVEFAVATDHNQVVDYGPAVAAIGADKYFTCIAGDEVTTWGWEEGIGHFCAYPMRPGSDPISTKPTTGRGIFSAMRNTAGRPLVQVNHPRWNGGAYFLHSGVGELTGRPGPRFDPGFDAVEIMNDATLFGWVENPQVREDWFNLLNRGLVFSAVANSDSHSTWSSPNGMPRTYIVSSTDDPEKIEVDEIIKMIKERRCTSGMGIFLTLDVNGTPMGGRTSARYGHVRAMVRVQAPGWINVGKVRLVVNGDTATAFDVPDVPENAPVRFEKEISLSLPEDSWVVAEAEGPDFEHPLYGCKILPRAATNPVWVDVDGNGRFDLMLMSVQRAVNIMKPEELWREAGRRPLRWVRMLVGELYDRGGEKAGVFLDRAASAEIPGIFSAFAGVAGTEEVPADPMLKASVMDGKSGEWGTAGILVESTRPGRGDLKIDVEWEAGDGTVVEPARRRIELDNGTMTREVFNVRWPVDSARGPLVSGRAVIRGGKDLPQVQNFKMRIYPVMRLVDLKTRPVIDGILTDWPRGTEIPRSIGVPVGRVMIARFGDSLFFAADVKDRSISVPDRTKPWLGDVLEFFIDTAKERGGDSYRATTHDILVLPAGGKGAVPAYVVRWHHDGDFLRENVYGETAVNAVCRKSVQGYVLEGSIPISLISPSGKLGKKFYLNYELRDTSVGSQHLSADKDDDTNSRPSTWAAVLAD